MFKKHLQFDPTPPDRSDVLMALGVAIVACFKAWDTSRKYKTAQNQEITQ